MCFIIPEGDESQTDKTWAGTNEGGAGLGKLQFICRVIAQAQVPQTQAVLIPTQRAFLTTKSELLQG